MLAEEAALKLMFKLQGPAPQGRNAIAQGSALGSKRHKHPAPTGRNKPVVQISCAFCLTPFQGLLALG